VDGIISFLVIDGGFPQPPSVGFQLRLFSIFY